MKKRNIKELHSNNSGVLAGCRDTKELAILFIHHRTDKVTIQNARSFRDLNPGVPIVLLSAGERFEGGYGLEDFPDFQTFLRNNGGDKWAYRYGIDLLICQWHRQRRIKADRWLIVEWDGWCGLPVREFLKEVWDFDVVAPAIYWPNREPRWYWFRDIPKLPSRLQPYAVGLTPTCFTMLSDKALTAVAETLPNDGWGDIIYELRLPTVAHSCGFIPAPIPRAASNITWMEIPAGTPLTRNLWHPIKTLVVNGIVSAPVPLQDANPGQFASDGSVRRSHKFTL